MTLRRKGLTQQLQYSLRALVRLRQDARGGLHQDLVACQVAGFAREIGVTNRAVGALHVFERHVQGVDGGAQDVLLERAQTATEIRDILDGLVDHKLRQVVITGVDGGCLARGKIGERVEHAVLDNLADAGGVDRSDADGGGIGGIDLRAEAEGGPAAGDAEGLALAVGIEGGIEREVDIEQIAEDGLDVESVGDGGGAVDGQNGITAVVGVGGDGRLVLGDQCRGVAGLDADELGRAVVGGSELDRLVIGGEDRLDACGIRELIDGGDDLVAGGGTGERELNRAEVAGEGNRGGASLRPVLEPRKLSWPVWEEVTTVTLTARVVAPTLAELMLRAVKAEVELRPEVE